MTSKAVDRSVLGTREPSATILARLRVVIRM